MLQWIYPPIRMDRFGLSPTQLMFCAFICVEWNHRQENYIASEEGMKLCPNHVILSDWLFCTRVNHSILLDYFEACLFIFFGSMMRNLIDSKVKVIWCGKFNENVIFKYIYFSQQLFYENISKMNRFKHDGVMLHLFTH